MTKSALCIGINDYPGTGSDLAGCVNDAHDWQAALERRGFTVRLLLNQEATRDAMQEAIGGVVREAQPGDLVVITYSGHGSWIPDNDSDEPDARDEVLCPYDIAQNRPLPDDTLYGIFNERQRGVRIVFISDSCHSGSVTRMPAVRSGADVPRIRFLPLEHFSPPEVVSRAAAQPTPRATDDESRPFGGVLLSGCQDTEYSYDAVFEQRPNGAFTYYALQALGKLPPDASYGDWYQAVRTSLPNQSQPQTPQFGGTRSQMGWQVFETGRRHASSDTRNVYADARVGIQQSHTTVTGEVSESNRRSTVTTATTDIEQTIRRVLGEVLNEVSDELAHDGGAQAPNGGNTGGTAPAPSNKAARAPAAQQPGTPAPGGPEAGTPAPGGQQPGTPAPGGPGGDGSGAPEQGGDTAVSPEVLTAVQKVARGLKPEQASALAAMFEALGGKPGGGEAGDGEEEVDPQTKALIDLATRKPAEFEATVDALSPHMVEEDDGTVTIAASRDAMQGVDEETYTALSKYFEQANQDVRSGELDGEDAQEGARILPFLWPILIRLIIRTAISMGAKIAWSKVKRGIAAVRANHRKFPGRPGSKPWLRAAARVFVRAM